MKPSTPTPKIIVLAFFACWFLAGVAIIAEDWPLAAFLLISSLLLAS